MADNGTKKGRKRAAGSKPPAKKPPAKKPNRRKPNRRKPRQDKDSESDGSDPGTPTIDEQIPLPPMEDEPATKLPEELLKILCKEPGVLLMTGMVSWDLVGKRERDNNKILRTHPNLFVFHKFTDRKYRLIVSGCNSAHSVLVSDDGKALTFGRNCNGQLGLGDTNTRNLPEEVPALTDRNIIHAATGRNHTLFLSDAGIVYACGDNRSGQCGVGNTVQQLLTPTRINYKGTPIVKVGCGADFSLILDCNGALHSFGLPEYGQLGHNTDGKYFVTCTRLTYHFELSPKRVALFIEKTRKKEKEKYFNEVGQKRTKDGHFSPIENVEIVDFSCGTNHTVAIDTKKRAYSWGFGGFGRLGHAEPRDESVPRRIKYFDKQSRGVRSVYCGSTYSLAINDIGGLFLFGQTKQTGEANMYPKPVQDLAGWNIRSIGASYTSIMISADDNLIAWGPWPAYGELGTGESIKSCAKPMEVTKMEGMKISQVTMGYSHTLVLCDDSYDAVKEKLAKFPVFDP